MSRNISTGNIQRQIREIDGVNRGLRQVACQAYGKAAAARADVDKACQQLGAAPARLGKLYNDAVAWASDAASAGSG